MNNHKNFLTVLACAIYGTFLVMAHVNGVFKYYAADAILSAGVILFFSLTYAFWRLNDIVFTLLILSFASHLMGVFGWYNVSPIGLQWDHVTHGLPLFAFTLFLFNFAQPWMGKKFWSAKTWSVLAVVLLAGMGIGAFIENMEFAGYLTFGKGEGAFFLGGPGDGVPLTSQQQEVIDNLGGGYINTEVDLVWNLWGALAAVIAASIAQYRIKKRAL